MLADQLLDEWKDRAKIAQKAHYKSAVRLERISQTLGVIVVALNAFVGTAVFATLVQTINTPWVKLGAGLTSIIAAILVGIQTFLRAGERAETHLRAATGFSILQRSVELFKATRGENDGEAPAFLKKFNKKYCQLVKESPTPNESEFLAATNVVRHQRELRAQSDSKKVATTKTSAR